MFDNYYRVDLAYECFSCDCLYDYLFVESLVIF